MAVGHVLPNKQRGRNNFLYDHEFYRDEHDLYAYLEDFMSHRFLVTDSDGKVDNEYYVYTDSTFVLYICMFKVAEDGSLYFEEPDDPQYGLFNMTNRSQRMKYTTGINGHNDYNYPRR